MKLKRNSNEVEIDITSLKVHRLVEMVYVPKDLEYLRFTLDEWGQFQPITCIKKNEEYFIIDGVSRYHAALKCSTKISSLRCTIIELVDNEILDYRIKLNTRTNKPISELCLELQHILGVLGKKQGVKREILGLRREDFETEEFKGVRKDRIFWARQILGIKKSDKTIRKLMKVFEEEEMLPKDKKTGVIKLLDKGRISIDKAYKISRQKERKAKELTLVSNRKIGGDLIGKGYQLYNKSSMIMDEVENETVRMMVQSSPYANAVRKYRFQDDLKHGQEETVDEFISNQIKFYREARKKLMPGGVLVLIIGESYLNGYQGVGTKLETALEADGWKIIDVNIWVKENPKYTPHPYRFVNAYEKIIVVSKPGSEPVFNDVKVQSSTGKFKVVAGGKRKNGETRYSMASPEASRQNVLITPTFNPSVLKNIDPDFTHDAPCREEIYETFIKAYSNPGDLILDQFVGACTLSVGLKLGRNIIGYDVDPVSIEFSKKRCEYVLNELFEEGRLAA